MSDTGPWDRYKQADTSGNQDSAGPWDKYKTAPHADAQHGTGRSDKKYFASDPTDDMTPGQTALAGIGKSFADTGRGAVQVVLDSPVGRDTDAYKNNQAAIDEAKRLDAPLLNTASGKAGFVGGKVLQVLPTMAIPGANTVAGSTLMGGAMGAVEPIATGDNTTRGENIGYGLAGGAAGPLVMRTGAAAVGGAKALAAPFSTAGREDIARRTLSRFGVNYGDVQGLNSGPTVTGARPMLADLIQDPTAAGGAARLTDSLKSVDPRFGAAIDTRTMENNAARVNTLNDIAGTDGRRDFYHDARSAVSQQNYANAEKAPFSAAALTPEQKAEMDGLLQSPAIRDATKQARDNALNRGADLGADGSLSGLHATKLQLDSRAAALRQSGHKDDAEAVDAASKRLVAFIESVSPDYKAARETHAGMSVPINQMDVAGRVLDKASSATPDLVGNRTLLPASMARVMDNQGKLIKDATGRDLPQKTLADLFANDPDRLAQLNAVRDELDRTAAVSKAANGPGSATASRMASQNILAQTLGPTGLPTSWADSALLSTMARPLQWGLSTAEPKIQSLVSEILSDPARAAAILKTNPKMLNSDYQRALPYIQQAAKTTIPAAQSSQP